MDLLRGLWKAWKSLALALARLQARVLLTVFYFVIVTPFALVLRMRQGPLNASPVRGSNWTDRHGDRLDIAAGRRQF